MQADFSHSSTFVHRLNIALQRAGLSRTALADHLNIAKSTITRWTHGALPRAEVTAKIADLCGVRREWLSAGIEPMEARESGRLQETSAERPPSTVDVSGELEGILTGMSDDVLKSTIEGYLSRVERDPADKRAVFLLRLLLSEVNLRTKKAEPDL